MKHSKGTHVMKLCVLLLGLVLFVLCDEVEGFEAGAPRDVENATASAAVLASVMPSAPASEGGNATDNATDGPTDPSPGARWVEPRTGMAFRWVPQGCFRMGSPKTEPGRNVDEGPQHEVCLSGFWLGETEVTQGQWTNIMGANPSLIKSGDDYPVDMVSWDMAQEFVAALNVLNAGTFRLPTEAEWEYACRAGTTTPFFFGQEITRDQASFDKRFSLPAEPLMPKRKTKKKKTAAKRQKKIWPNMHTSVVGSYPANAYGLHDMHGNVWEWCQDVYKAEYYFRSPRENPRCDGEGASRVLRGGSWVTKGDALRSANRSRGWPNLSTAFYGLRVVFSAQATGAPKISR